MINVIYQIITVMEVLVGNTGGQSVKHPTQAGLPVNTRTAMSFFSYPENLHGWRFHNTSG